MNCANRRRDDPHSPRRSSWSRFACAVTAPLLAFVVIAACPLSAQPVADELSQRALEHYQRGSRRDQDTAVGLWRHALRLYLKSGNHDGQAVVSGYLALAFDHLGPLDSALVYGRHTLLLRRRHGTATALAVALDFLGSVHARLGNTDSASVYYRTALTLVRDSRDSVGERVVLNNLGFFFSGIGQKDSALVFFRRALTVSLATGNIQDQGRLYNNLGGVHLDLGSADSAIHYFSRAASVSSRARDRRGEASALSNLGGAYLRTGRVDVAHEHLVRALALQRIAGDRSGEAGTLTSLSAVHHDLGRIDSALVYLDSALRILESTGQTAELTGTLSTMATLMMETERPDAALYYLERARALARLTGGEGLAATLNNLGTVAEDRGEHARALSLLRESLAITERRGSDRAVTLNNMGAVYASLGQFDSASSYYRQALDIYRAGGDPAGEAVTLGNLAILYHRRIANLSEAARYYEAAAVRRANTVRLIRRDDDQLRLNEQGATLYGLWALSLLGTTDSSYPRPTEQRTLAALAASERGRAQALLSLLRSQRSEIAVGADLTSEGAASASVVRLSGAAAALHYEVTPDTLLIWLILPSGQATVVRTPIKLRELNRSVRAARDALGIGTACGPRPVAVVSYEEVLHSLSEILLPPEVRTLLPPSGEILIVPHGFLGEVPFAALPFAGSDEPLGIRYALRFTPSLNLLAAVEELPLSPRGTLPAEALQSALVVGNPAMAPVTVCGVSHLIPSPLVWADSSSRRIAGLLGVERLGDSAANEPAVRERLTHARIIHFETHAYAYGSEDLARESFVVLAAAGEAASARVPGNDGRLTVAEIIDEVPALTAELVVLGACQTALGEVLWAEGVVGFQRAFLAKRARSVLASLWSVDDQATAVLLEAFYRYWLGPGPVSKAEALRLAQLEVWKRPAWRHPRYWAAFQLAGAR